MWKAAGTGGRRVTPLLELDSPAGDTGVPGPGWGKQSEQHSPGCCSAAGWATRVPVLCHPVCRYRAAWCCTVPSRVPVCAILCAGTTVPSAVPPMPAPHAGYGDVVPCQPRTRVPAVPCQPRTPGTAPGRAPAGRLRRAGAGAQPAKRQICSKHLLMLGLFAAALCAPRQENELCWEISSLGRSPLKGVHIHIMGKERRLLTMSI